MIPDQQPRTPDELKPAARALGCTVKDLLVLDRSNDPFNVGTPGDVRNGKWFAELWHRFGYVDKVHNRRVHYNALSVGAKLPNGEPYLNTTQCWHTLEKASAAARDLGILDPRRFKDKRNADCEVNAHARYEDPEPAADVVLWDNLAPRDHNGFGLPDISAVLPGAVFRTGRVEVTGYDYQPADQPYLIEVWIEKSTMDDVLVPLCRSLGANYTPGTGFTSKTRIVDLLGRAAEHDKPVRVFIISDFDPAGSHMPPAIARNIEFYRDLIAPGVEFAVHHVGMTREWVQRYDLPRVPIAESEWANVQGRTDRFQAIHGEGCVELDALEALHPGALAREIRAEITRYIDDDLPRALETAEWAAQSYADREWQATTEPIREELDVIKGEVDQVADRYRERLRALSEELAAELDPYRERLDELWDELVDLAEEPIEGLPERPGGQVEGADESGWLYDSRRHWFDQLAAYRRRHKTGEAA